MGKKISDFTYEIAVASAWKVFAALLAAAGLLIVSMSVSSSVNRLGFILFGAMLFGWLSSIAVELKRANGLTPNGVGGLGALGLLCLLAFSFPDYMAFAVPKEFGTAYFTLSGVGVLVCMGYLALSIDRQLAKLESHARVKSKISAFLLLWMWPVGVWSLQPRLRQVLCKLPTT